MQKTKKRSRLGRYFIEVRKNGLAFNLLGMIPFIWGILTVLLFGWGLLVCFAEPNWYLENSNTFFIKEFTLDNFRTAVTNFKLTLADARGHMREVGFWDMTFNSFWFAAGTTIVRMIATTCFAYAVARFDFKGKKLLYGFVILQMMLPVYGSGAANYNLLYKFGMVNTPFFLLAMGSGHGMYFLLMHSFFTSLPVGYEEAAKIDGANAFQIFAKVMIPLARPIIGALTIMTMIGCWSDYSTVLIYLPGYPNLSTGLFMIKERAFAIGLQTPSYFAAIFLSILPVVIVYILFNKTIMENVSFGGLKG